MSVNIAAVRQSIGAYFSPITDRVVNAACTAGLVEDPQEITVEDANAQFRVTSAAERWRVNGLMNERPIAVEILSTVRPGDSFWDVGAAVGTYACLADSLGARVVAFEPHPVNAARCRQNTSLNDADVDVREFALGATKRRARLASAGGVGVGMHYLASSGSITIDIHPGDTVDAPDPDVIKIDVEGHEVAVLEGIPDRLAGARAVFVECHKKDDSTVPDVQRLLEAADFVVDSIDFHRNETYLIGRR